MGQVQGPGTAVPQVGGPRRFYIGTSQSGIFSETGIRSGFSARHWWQFIQNEGTPQGTYWVEKAFRVVAPPEEDEPDDVLPTIRFIQQTNLFSAPHFDLPSSYVGTPGGINLTFGPVPNTTMLPGHTYTNSEGVEFAVRFVHWILQAMSSSIIEPGWTQFIPSFRDEGIMSPDGYIFIHGVFEAEGMPPRAPLPSAPADGGLVFHHGVARAYQGGGQGEMVANEHVLTIPLPLGTTIGTEAGMLGHTGVPNQASLPDMPPGATLLGFICYERYRRGEVQQAFVFGNHAGTIAYNQVNNAWTNAWGSGYFTLHAYWRMPALPPEPPEPPEPPLPPLIPIPEDPPRPPVRPPDEGTEEPGTEEPPVEPTVTVHFDANLHPLITENLPSLNISFDSVSGTQTQNFRLPQVDIGTKPGFMHVGWSFTPRHEYPPAYDVRVSFRPEAYDLSFGGGDIDREVTLYAIWDSLMLNVVYNANGGTGVTPPNDIGRITQDVDISEASLLTRQNHHFMGWAFDMYAPSEFRNDTTIVESGIMGRHDLLVKSGETLWAFGTSATPLPLRVVLYALWSPFDTVDPVAPPPHNIRFDANAPAGELSGNGLVAENSPGVLEGRWEDEYGDTLYDTFIPRGFDITETLLRRGFEFAGWQFVPGEINLEAVSWTARSALNREFFFPATDAREHLRRDLNPGGGGELILYARWRPAEVTVYLMINTCRDIHEGRETLNPNFTDQNFAPFNRETGQRLSVDGQHVFRHTINNPLNPLEQLRPNVSVHQTPRALSNGISPIGTNNISRREYQFLGYWAHPTEGDLGHRIFDQHGNPFQQAHTLFGWNPLSDERLLTAYNTTGHHFPGHGLAPGQQRLSGYVVRLWARWAVSVEFIHENPAQGVHGSQFSDNLRNAEGVLYRPGDGWVRVVENMQVIPLPQGEDGHMSVTTFTPARGTHENFEFRGWGTNRRNADLGGIHLVHGTPFPHTLLWEPVDGALFDYRVLIDGPGPHRFYASWMYKHTTPVDTHNIVRLNLSGGHIVDSTLLRMEWIYSFSFGMGHTLSLPSVEWMNNEFRNFSNNQIALHGSSPLNIFLGKTFVGWAPNADLSGSHVTQIEDGSSGILEFWAIWEPTTQEDED